MSQRNRFARGGRRLAVEERLQEWLRAPLGPPSAGVALILADAGIGAGDVHNYIAELPMRLSPNDLRSCAIEHVYNTASKAQIGRYWRLLNLESPERK